MFFLTQGNYRFMKLLLARRGNWMQKDLEDMTPLHLTTRHKSPKCLALLLKHMAPGEVDTQDKNKVKILVKDNTCSSFRNYETVWVKNYCSTLPKFFRLCEIVTNMGIIVITVRNINVFLMIICRSSLYLVHWRSCWEHLDSYSVSFRV